MPTQRLSMRRIRQLLALHFGAGASSRLIGRELGIAPSTVREYLGRAAAAGVVWPLAAGDTDESLTTRLFVNAGVRAGARFHAEPDWSALARELKRPGVNLMILWDEYRAVHPEGYAYSRFCQLFREFERRLSPVTCPYQGRPVPDRPSRRAVRPWCPRRRTGTARSRRRGPARSPRPCRTRTAWHSRSGTGASRSRPARIPCSPGAAPSQARPRRRRCQPPPN